jgi:hypothetical protein
MVENRVDVALALLHVFGIGVRGDWVRKNCMRILILSGESGSAGSKTDDLLIFLSDERHMFFADVE